MRVLHQHLKGNKFIREFLLVPDKHFRLVLFPDSTVEILTELSSMKRHLVGHCDATGSLIRQLPPVFGEKKIFNYVVSVTHPKDKEPPIAMLEIITNNHTADSIRECLKIFVDE